MAAWDVNGFSNRELNNCISHKHECDTVQVRTSLMHKRDKAIKELKTVVDKKITILYKN